jgi:hypothetical protein
MRPRWLAGMLLLCALRADGDPVQVSARMIDVLTVIDELPSKTAVTEAFPTADALRTVALDTSLDLSIQLRAIRVLPSLCDLSCGIGSTVHDALTAIIANPSRAPKDILRLRAAVEALGTLGTAIHDDVLALVPLLDDDSRDVRTTVVRALSGMGDCTAKAPLLRRQQSEKVRQVQLALNAALPAFDQCH